MARNVPGVHSYKLTDGSVRYRVRLFAQGRRHTWSGFVYKDEATTYYQDRKRDLREGRRFPTEMGADLAPPVPRTLALVIDDYLVTASLKKNYGGEVTYATFWKAQLGTAEAAAVTPTHIDAARKTLLQSGASGATVNRYTAWCHHVYRMEIEAERLTKNPCRLFVKPARRGGHRLPERPAPDVVWSDDELERLAKELGHDILYPLLAMLTGLRQDEQFSLRKDALDLERGIGRLHDPKAGTNQVFHINDDAARIFAHFLAKSGDSPFVFPSPRWPMDKPMQGTHWYATRFKPAGLRAGIEMNRQTGRTWHTLRHSFADRLANLSVPVLDIQEAGRWSSWQVMRRYVKKSNPRVQAAVQKLTVPAALAHFLTLGDRDDITEIAQGVDSTGLEG